MRPYAFGVDIGGTAVKLGLFGTNGEPIEKWSIPTRTQDSGNHVLPDVIDSIRSKLHELGLPWDKVEGVGMGVPGPVREDGTVMRCINLEWGVFNIPEKIRTLEPHIHRFRISNDVNAAALGEQWKGAAKGRNNVFMITLGTGIGGGLVINEQIVNGAGGGAGEIGHFCVDPNETEFCKCGGRGCLEQYCSATGLLRCAEKALAEQPEISTVLKNKKYLTAKGVCDAARAGDKLALELLERLGDLLGWALNAVAGTVDPEIFVIGGGLSNAGDILLEPIVKGYRSHAFHALQETEFTLAKLGNDAGIYGCVRMLL